MRNPERTPQGPQTSAAAQARNGASFSLTDAGHGRAIFQKCCYRVFGFPRGLARVLTVFWVFTWIFPHPSPVLAGRFPTLSGLVGVWDTERAVWPSFRVTSPPHLLHPSPCARPKFFLSSKVLAMAPVFPRLTTCLSAVPQHPDTPSGG